MENLGIEELLSSFSSDGFAIQSQTEKDLRASLLNFFSLQHGPNGTNHHLMNNNTHSSPVGFLNQTTSTPLDVQMGQTCKSSNYSNFKAELPPSNTPIGSPRKEELSTLSQNPVINYEGNHDQTTQCIACLHLFSQGYSPFPHAQNCHHFQDRFEDNNLNSHVTNDANNPSESIQTAAPYRIDGFLPSSQLA